MTKPILMILCIAICASACGQTSYDRYHENVRKTRETRMKALHAENSARAEQRYNKAAYRRYKSAIKMRQDSQMMFGNERLWTSGINSLTGVLSSITSQKKAVLLESEKNVFDATKYHVVKVDELSASDQEYVKAWGRFKKLKPDEKKFVIERFYAALEDAKSAAMRQASEPFKKLVEGFDKIEIGDTKKKAYEVLGDQVEVSGARSKTRNGTTERLSWWAHHPENKRKVYVRIRFANGKVETIDTVNFNPVQLKESIDIEEIKALNGYEILFKDHFGGKK